jgi:hypothetical protein
MKKPPFEGGFFVVVKLLVKQRELLVELQLLEGMFF